MKQMSLETAIAKMTESQKHLANLKAGIFNEDEQKTINAFISRVNTKEFQERAKASAAEYMAAINNN